ncbi:MAG: PadR family transcriptional regulator [Candidatus Bipolaricaulota bacterium]
MKFYVLKLLQETNMTGYGIMKAIKKETGFWEPSTGSLYPLLESLEEGGLIECANDSNGKLWQITPRGERSFEESDQAKEELFQGMKRSLFVFAKVFGEEGIQELFKEAQHWRGNKQKQIEKKKKYMKIGRVVMHLEEYDEWTRQEIITILDNALEQLGELDLEVNGNEYDNQG